MAVAAAARPAGDAPLVPPGYRVDAVLLRSAWRISMRAERLADGAMVVLKTVDAQYPTRQQVAELQREHRILQRLQSVPGVVRLHGLLRFGNGNLAIETAWVGRSLAHTLAQSLAEQGSKPGLPLAQVLELAAALAQTLGQVHEHDIVHKNIEPRSVVLDGTGQSSLIDFGFASELSLERQNDSLERRLEGALPYLSPEQTGRMNRDLDYRSDFYSLGILLFELLTGRLPFEASSALEWVHSHISRPPPAASEFNPTVPMAVSALVHKLLAKNAEDRYQSSFGLLEDLSRCTRELAQTGHIAPFALGHRDVSRRFSIAQKLYGRQAELATLMLLFEQVAAGETVICMVSGFSGVGKSALVMEIQKPLVRRGGFLIQGKFDQFQRGTPYSALAAALGGLARQLLAEPEPQRQAWCESLLVALTPNARLLLELAPEFEPLLGPQPAVPELPPAEAHNRFQITLINFIRVMTAEQPLVVFLDDLQFSDAATLKLIRWLGGARELPRLMLIGAYRSNEVDAGHPLRLALEEIRTSRPIHDLQLRPLGMESVEQLLADSLHTDAAACRPLAQLMHERTEGNPFFIAELLKTVVRSKAISFVPEAGRWRWDLEAVRATTLSGNVVDFVLANLRRLQPETQRALQLAACIGSSFDLHTLAVIHESSPDHTAIALLPALQRNVVIPLLDNYRLVGTGAAEALPGDINPTYRFQHDRVQQAAYALIDDEDKQAVHLSVGRLILGDADVAQRQARLIDIVGHLNQGLRLITDPVERLQLARLNLDAGIQAQRSTAYGSALQYLSTGQALLPADAWTKHYKLAMALALEHQQCAYLTARYDEAEAAIEQMLARAQTALEKAEILAMRTRQYATTGKMEASIRSAIMGLALLGLRISGDPDPAAIKREAAAVRRNLAGRRIADLIDAPPLTDPSQKVAIRLLMEIFPAAFLSGSGSLFPYLVLKSVNISLSHGTSPESAFAYAAYGMLLCGALDKPALGFEYGQLAVAMNDRLADITLKSRVIYVYAMFVHHWSRHWSSMTPWFRRGIESGYESGDLLYLAYSAQDCIIWDPTLDLESAEQEHAEYLGVVRDTGYQDSIDSGTLFLQMQRNFLGRTDGLCSMNDAGFDEQRCLQGMHERKFMTGVANYHIYKAEICWLYGEHAQAWVHVLAQEQMLASAMSLPQLVRFVIVAFFTRAARLPQMAAAEQLQARLRLRAELRRMSRWAAHCPENFSHLQGLMQAELARLDGQVDKALRLFEVAIAAAATHEWRRDEAMANELAARHLLAAGRRKAAEGYLRAARHLYQRWGARRKVEHLESEFASIFEPEGRRADASDAVMLDGARLDLASVMKASQAISGEIVLEQLWATTMQLMLENAGGQRGCFVVYKEGQLVIEGLCEAGQAAPAAGSTPLEGASGAQAVPITILYQVLNTRSPLVLHDASAAGPFARDAYVQRHLPRSVLCVPLVRQGRFEGAMYMENRLAAGVFSESRIELIRLLAAQVSISLENARLVQDQVRLIDAQRRFVPREFLESLNHGDIARVALGENVAKTMSVGFADLRGFTPLAESLDARSVIGLLNSYFAAMALPISQAGGFIDSFAGDEIKILFDTGADAALRGAIGMWRALEDFNARARALGQPELNMGVGLNTGPVVLGTVGGADRLQCSVIGDTVNLASRIEQLTKVYGARLLIGDATFKSLAEPGAFALRCVDRVAVKGRQLAVGLYEVLDAEPATRREKKQAGAPMLEQAMARYAGREFEAALPLFQQLRVLDSQDLVPPLFIERCERYRIEPPPADWQGFERLSHK